MRLLCDGGSTKALWSDGSGGFFRTTGCNPRFLDEPAIAEVLRLELLPQLNFPAEACTEVVFYGAGCATETDCARVENALRSVFVRAKATVGSDLLGAARWVCADRPGLICILGTGSNAARWDGQRVADALPSLGFLLGDEGSGAELGKRLLKAFFYRELPIELNDRFRTAYPWLDRAAALEALYDRPMPNRWCAEFALFYGKNRGNEWIEKNLHEEFSAFVSRRVVPLFLPDLPVHAVGGIAWNFRDVWKKCLEEKNLAVGEIILSPLPL